MMSERLGFDSLGVICFITLLFVTDIKIVK